METCLSLCMCMCVLVNMSRRMAPVYGNWKTAALQHRIFDAHLHQYSCHFIIF